MKPVETKSHKIVTLFVFLAGLGALTAVNFLGKEAANKMDALPLNGSRLLVGASIFGVVSLLLGLSLRASREHMWRYGIAAVLNMALPQALLFEGLRNYGARTIDAAVIEAAIPGLILIYLFTGHRRFQWRSLVAASIALVGLVVFLGILDMQTDISAMRTGSWLLLVSAVVTSIGLITDDKMKWPSEPRPKKEWNNTIIGKAAISKSLRKSLYCSAIAGTLTLASVPLLNWFLPPEIFSETITVPPSAWPAIFALALVGTCISWFAIFYLIQIKQLILVVAMVAGVPIVTAIFNIISGRPSAQNLHEWLGGVVLLIALGYLVKLQLTSPNPTTVAQS